MRHIYIVDDDPGIQELLRIILEREGYRVSIDGTGKTVLEDNFECPDIFLLDRDLLGLDGLDICRHLKSAGNICSSTPVIMLSASLDIASRALEAGADEFLEKPFNMQDLLTLIEKFLSEKNETVHGGQNVSRPTRS